MAYAELKERQIYRAEKGSELTIHEVDNNFKKVANYWEPTREYHHQDIVYYNNGDELSWYMATSCTRQA